MAAIAIITARGGSKRIPKKNVREFCGKPILAYSIEAALQSGLFDEVMVSTDSAEIAEVAKRCGARVPFMRSEKTSNDYATTNEVLAEVLAEYAALGQRFDWFCCIYPTAPFLTAQRLKQAFATLGATGCQAVMPVVRFSFPPQRGLVVQDGVLGYRYPEFAKSRSQDLEPIYHDCGQFYLCTTAAFAEHGTAVPPATAPLVLPEEVVQDIDTPEDWAMAELKYKLLHKAQKDGTDV